MAVDIRFYDLNNEEITKDKITGGHNFGICRKNQAYVYPVVIKNTGTNDARNISIQASPLDAPQDVSVGEYTSQQLASTWKTFSLFPDEQFSQTLTLPNIQAGTTLLGKKKIVDNFSNPQLSSWMPIPKTGMTYSWTGNSLKASADTGVTSYFSRINGDGYGDNKEFDITYNFSMPLTTSAGAAFIMFGFRMNSLGDEKGYLVNIKRNVTSGIIFFEIRKAAGIKTNGVNEFGTALIQSQNIAWTDFQPIRIKLFTNSNNQPEFKVWVNNILDTDTPVQWGLTTPTSSYIDTASTYSYAGGACIILGVGATSNGTTFEFRNSKLITNDANGKVYIKTIVGDGAIDQRDYKSSLELFYDPI